MTRLIVGPFNRVEGDLEVKLDIKDDQVEAAWVSSSLYRGFEQILEGKTPGDALVFAPRICGICSISQSVAASSALRNAMGLEQAPNGLLATNLLSATENLADHLTHFYLFFMPDFARDTYVDQPWGEAAQKRFKAMQGEASSYFLPARKNLLQLIGILAGKWPHTLAIQPGGTTKTLDQGDRVRVISVLSEIRRFLEEKVFGDKLEAILELSSFGELFSWADNQPMEQGDFRFFLKIAQSLALEEVGKTSCDAMSYGTYDGLFPQGVWRGEVGKLDPQLIAEDLTHSMMIGDTRHPSQGETFPDLDKADAYTLCKAPRLDGKVVEVGAYARQLIAGQPLIINLAHKSGSNVLSRVVGRLIEAARLVTIMEEWVDGFKIKEPFCSHGKMPDEVEAVGMTEAARGSLGHWLHVREGRIENYQIVSPTTWNFSPRDSSGISGPLESALVGVPVIADEKNPVVVQHIVRSFDPCMVCTVH
ncbi:MAG: nickel-dependent hydrogenase large subunit [Alphaproteobacteria bacterium]|nr:nickel-dependent hydrogenase large subunit [Alphaproteobacteria bacterium]